jgi:phytoene dehydrogenase-like protein
VNGGWDARRDEVGRQFLDLIGRFAPDIEDCLVDYEVLGAPDIEERVGLTGGHIFQGEVRPDQMWEHRLTPRTEMPGVYLCAPPPTLLGASSPPTARTPPRRC